MEDGNEKANLFLKNLVQGTRHSDILQTLRLPADLRGWQEAAAGPSIPPTPGGSSDSVSLTSGPSACLVLQNGLQFLLQNDPMLEVGSLEALERTGVPVCPRGF